MPRLTAHFTGRVQGVGFRATTARLAQGFDVTGTVENLPDGRVRLVAEGQQTELRAFLHAIESTFARHISRVQTDTTPGTDEFGDFRVRY